MHILHIVASEGESATDAQAAAEEGIGHYGNGDVWDWYEVGGRWDGFIGATGETEEDYVPGVNQLCYAENPELFNETIDTSINGRNAYLLDALRAIRGDVVAPESVPDHFMGIPVVGVGSPKGKEGIAKRLSEKNAEYGAEWQALLACNTAAELGKISGLGPHYVFYKVYKLMKGVMGHYDFDSRFYDTASGSTGRSYVDERKGCDPNKQWITVFDLHN